MKKHEAPTRHQGLTRGLMASALGFLVVALVLAAPGEAVKREAFFLPPVAGGFSDIRRTSWKLEMSVDGRQFLDLQSLVPGALVASERLIFKVAVPSGGVSINGARLILHDPVISGEVILFTAGPRRLRGGEQSFVLLRTDGAGALKHQGPLTGRIEIEGASQVLALSVGVSTERPPSELLGFATGGVFVSPEGWRESTTSDFIPSRASLLAHTWGWRSAFPVYAFLGGAALLWIAGVWLMAGYRLQPAAGAGLMFLAATTAWAVIIPPFHGPDESDHLLSFAALVGRPALADDALALANRGHFERIKLRRDEKFTAADVGRPRSDAWAPHVIPEPVGRSPLAALLWSAPGFLLRGDGAAPALLALRLYGSVLVAAALVFALLAVAVVMRVHVYWLAVPALLIPSLSFWSAMLSNYAFLVAGYFWQAAALGILWFTLDPSMPAKGGKRPIALAGLLAGGGCGIAVCSGDNGLFSCVFWALAVPAWMFASSRRDDTECPSWRESLLLPIAWSSALLAVFTVVGFLTANGEFLPARLLEALRAHAKENALPSLLIILWLFWVAVLCPFLVQLGRRWNSWPRWRDARLCLAAFWMIAVFMATFGGWPRLVDIEQPEHSLEASNYVVRAVHAFVQGFGGIRADWFVVNSFWGWFGWLDAPLPQVFTILLRMFFVGGLLLLLVRSFVRPDFPASNVFLGMTLLAVLVCVGFTAGTAYQWGVNVHGRYLIAPYLLVCTTCVEGYRRMWASSVEDPRLAAVLLAGTASVVQTLSWAFVLPRYL